MPIKKRLAKLRATDVSFDARMALQIGDHPRQPVFQTAKAARAAWRLCRADILARTRPGHRPVAWWQFDAKEDRDHSQTEAGQLYGMGVMDEAEIDRYRQDHAHHEAVAWERYKWHRDYQRRPETGQHEYHRWRFEMGIDDEILPPRVPRPAAGWQERERDVLSTYDLAKLNGGAPHA